MQIYRVECANGKGAYRYPWNTFCGNEDSMPAWVRDQHKDYDDSDDDPHPAPCQDGLGVIKNGEYFAFDTLEKIRNWMFLEAEDAEKMQKAGMYVVVLDVPEQFVRVGRRQCVYEFRQAKPVNRYKPALFQKLFLNN